MKSIILLACVLLGTLGYVRADCYPGDTQFNAIVNEIYRGVITDNIQLSAHGSTPLSRDQLCSILVNRHSHGKNNNQPSTNEQYLGTSIPYQTCLDALTSTSGYQSHEWFSWAGYHEGHWYATKKEFSDGAEWFSPDLEALGSANGRQAVRFDSIDRIQTCTTPNVTGATCRYGWNQAGTGVPYVWGWDPKNNDCPEVQARGRIEGTHVGFTFNHNGAYCIIWVTPQEAFLECIKHGFRPPYDDHFGARFRTSTASGPGDYEGYGQWIVFRTDPFYD